MMVGSFVLGVFVGSVGASCTGVPELAERAWRRDDVWGIGGREACRCARRLEKWRCAGARRSWWRQKNIKSTNSKRTGDRSSTQYGCMRGYLNNDAPHTANPLRNFSASPLGCHKHSGARRGSRRPVSFRAPTRETSCTTVHSGADVSKASVTDASHRACHPSRQFPTDTDQSRTTGSSVDLS